MRIDIVFKPWSVVVAAASVAAVGRLPSWSASSSYGLRWGPGREEQAAGYRFVHPCYAPDVVPFSALSIWLFEYPCLSTAAVGNVVMITFATAHRGTTRQLAS